MRFVATRRSLSGLRSVKLRQDLEALVGAIEKAAKTSKEVAGSRTSMLIAFSLALRNALPKQARTAVVNAVFDDAARLGVPHQWSRHPGFECGPNNDCTVANPDTTCCRDTSSASCYTVQR